MPSAVLDPEATLRAPVATKPTSRLAGLDRLRGLALLMMLVHHFTGWLTHSPREVLPGFDGLALTDLAAPAFAITAGASLALFVDRALHRGTDGNELGRQVLRRYGVLVPVGMLLTLAALSNPFYFGVLDALGWGALAAYVVLRLIPTAGLGWAAAATMFLASRPAATFVEDHATTDYVVNAFSGKFPILEYAGFAVVGALVAPHLKRWSTRHAIAVAVGSVLVAGLVSLVVGPPDRYPGGIAFVVPGLAGTAVLYALMLCWTPSPGVERSLVVSGTRSLGIYVSHYVLFVVLRAAGLQESLDPWPALLIALMLTTGVVVAALRLPPLPFSLRKGSAARRSEVGPQERDRVGPDLVAVGRRVGVSGKHDESVIDLRGS